MAFLRLCVGRFIYMLLYNYLIVIEVSFVSERTVSLLCDAEIVEDGKAVRGRERYIQCVERETYGMCHCPAELLLSC